MQNLTVSNQADSALELFHVQTQTSFDLPPSLTTIRIGKFNDQSAPDIDISALPDSELVSRLHLQIYTQGNSQEKTYWVEDLGSSNGTFLNNQRLLPQTPQPLNLGDRINLGQGSKVTFIFQAKPEAQEPPLQITVMPAETNASQLASRQNTVDRVSRFTGLVLLSAAVVMLAANTHVGIFFSAPALLLCLAGMVVLFQKRIDPDWGWLLIALGVGIMIFSGRIFASTNLLTFLMAAALFVGGYRLFQSGKLLP